MAHKYKIITQFREWLLRATPGEEFAYHSGLLARDRDHLPEVEAVARDAMVAHEQGLVVLLQSRLPGIAFQYGRKQPGGCLYLARRTRNPIPGMEADHG